MMLNRKLNPDLERDKHGIVIEKEHNTCIFHIEWSYLDLEKLEFTDKIYGENWGLLPEDDLICSFCGRDLNLGYVFIIHQLRVAGLLPDFYVSMCCFCNILACIGFWIPPDWIDVIVRESCRGIKNGVILLISACDMSTGEPVDIEVRIYDIDLSLKTGRVFNDVGMY